MVLLIGLVVSLGVLVLLALVVVVLSAASEDGDVRRARRATRQVDAAADQVIADMAAHVGRRRGAQPPFGGGYSGGRL